MSFLDGLKDFVADANEIAQSASGVINTVKGAPKLSPIQEKATASVPYQYPGDVSGRTENIGTPLAPSKLPYVFMFGAAFLAILFVRRA